MQLTQEQVDFYKKEGYLVIRREEHNLFEAKDLQGWVKEVQNWPRTKEHAMQYDEINVNGERQLMRTEYYADFHEQLGDLLRGDAFTGILQQLSGNEMRLFKDKINYKAPNGNGFGAHLDAPAYDHMGKIKHLTINVAVDPSTKENGYLEVVKGSHEVDVPIDPESKSIVEDWCKKQTWEPVPLNPGDMLIFGSYLAHRSGENRSTNPRASIYATYNARSDGEDLRTPYYAHRRATFPPDHERVEGEKYEEGWKQYAFAAPFIRPAVKTN